MESSEGRNWSVILPIAMLVGMVSGTFHVFSIFFVPVKAEFGWNSTATAAVFSVSQLVFLIAQFPGGWLADRINPTRVMIGGVVLFSAGISAMALSGNLMHVFIFYGLMGGCGLGGIWTPAMALVNRLFYRYRGWAMGVVVTANSAWVAIMGPAARFLVGTIGWRTGYLLLGLAQASISLTMMALLLRALRKTAPPRAEVSVTSLESRSAGAGSWTLRDAWRSPQLWLLSFSSFGIGLGASVLLVHLVPYAIAGGAPEVLAAAALTAFGLSRIPTSLGLGWLADKVSRRGLLGVCILILAGAVLALYRLGPTAALIPAAAIFGMGWSAGVMLIAPITTDLFGPAHIGGIYAIVHGGFTAGSVAGPVLAGYVYDSSGYYEPAILLSGLTLLAAGAALFLLRAPSRNN